MTIILIKVPNGTYQRPSMARSTMAHQADVAPNRKAAVAVRYASPVDEEYALHQSRARVDADRIYDLGPGAEGPRESAGLRRDVVTNDDGPPTIERHPAALSRTRPATTQALQCRSVSNLRIPMKCIRADTITSAAAMIQYHCIS